MLTRLSLVLSLLQLISAKRCPACDSLRSLWNPDTNKGSCVGSHKDPVKFIINFHQCICGPRGQNDYQACTECKLDPGGGVPIDGLNFGPLSMFQAQCSTFEDDIDNILKPSGLVSFVNSIRPESIVEENIAEEDIIAIEILSAITITVSGLGTHATAIGTTPSGKSVAEPTSDVGEGVSNISDSGRISPTSSVFVIIALAVTAAVFF